MSSLLCVLILSIPLAASDWSRGFADPRPEYGMGVYWWWFGPAVTKQEVERELDVMHRAKISYALIFPIYPLSVDDPARGIRNLRYLSPEFLDVLRHTALKAKERGITLDLLIGTGWPYGGPSITPELAAKRMRVGPPELKEHEAVIEQAPAMTLIQSPTGMQVKRPSLGGEGLVMDHLSREALETYLNAVGAKLLDAVPPGTVRALHSDSLEVFGTEWTGGLLDEFRRRRGYDLAPHLPALVAESGPLTADLRHDFWKTLSDVALDNYVRPLHQWCRARGVTLQSESYGSPPVDMRSFREIDHPMGESYDWKMFVASRWASSAAHQYGKRTTSAEAYTWLRFPRYVSTLEDVKLGSDLHFICGINKIVAHGYAYSPPAVGVPGWGYYASIMMNDTNPWWPYFPLLSDYVRRVSYALSLAKPKVDVALYLPEDDVMAEQPVGQGRGLNLYMTTKFKLGGGRVPEFGLPAAFASESAVIKTLITSGYTFDGFDHGLLDAGLRTSGGRLEAGDVAYRIAVLPNLTGVSLAILERLVEFCRAGGVVIATRRLPERVYGVEDREANQARLRALISEIFGEGRQGRHRCGKGLGIFVADDTVEFARELAALGPEIRFERPDADLVFLHRGDESRDIYFLANTSRELKTFRARFRDGKGRPRFWNAMTGAISEVPVFARTEIPLRLDPLGSTLVVFENEPGGAPATATDVPAPLPAIAVAGPWTLRIEGRETRLAELRSWTELPAHRFHAGRGDYTVTFDLPAVAARGFWLELGEVREIAEVRVNGEQAGVAWMRPYRLDVSKWLRVGRNTLEIGVTNLLINRVLGAPEPDYSGLEPLRFPQPEEKKRVPEPLPSGLLGPVQLVPYKVSAAR